MPFFSYVLIPTFNAFQDYTNELGLRFLDKNHFTEAYQAWHAAFLHRKTPPSEYDPEWCNSVDLIGLKLYLQGRPRDAEPYFQEALAEKQRTLDSRDSRLYKTVTHLARALAAQSKHEEAEMHFQRALDFYEKYHGLVHEETLQVKLELAAEMMQRGKLRGAEKQIREVLGLRERHLGMKSQETLESVWTLASILEKQGERKEALRLYKRVYEGARKVVGEEHVDTRDYLADYTRLARHRGKRGFTSCIHVLRLKRRKAFP